MDNYKLIESGEGDGTIFYIEKNGKQEGLFFWKNGISIEDHRKECIESFDKIVKELAGNAYPYHKVLKSVTIDE